MPLIFCLILHFACRAQFCRDSQLASASKATFGACSFRSSPIDQNLAANQAASCSQSASGANSRRRAAKRRQQTRNSQKPRCLSMSVDLGSNCAKIKSEFNLFCTNLLRATRQKLAERGIKNVSRVILAQFATFESAKSARQKTKVVRQKTKMRNKNKTMQIRVFAAKAAELHLAKLFRCEPIFAVAMQSQNGKSDAKKQKTQKAANFFGFFSLLCLLCACLAS